MKIQGTYLRSEGHVLFRDTYSSLFEKVTMILTPQANSFQVIYLCSATKKKVMWKDLI